MLIEFELDDMLIADSLKRHGWLFNDATRTALGKKFADDLWGGHDLSELLDESCDLLTPADIQDVIDEQGSDLRIV